MVYRLHIKLAEIYLKEDKIKVYLNYFYDILK